MKMIKVFLILFISKTQLLEAAAIEKIEISVAQPVIRVLAGEPIKLFHIARVSALPVQERDRLGELILYPVAESKTFTSGEILRKIKNVILMSGQFDEEQFQFSSPEAVQIVTAQNEISENQIHYQAISEILKLCSHCRVHSLDLRFPKHMPTHWDRYQLNFLMSKVQKTYLLPVDLIGTERPQRIFVQLDLGIEKKSLVASHEISRGEALNSHNTRTEWKVWDGFSRFANPDEVIGKVASQNFQEGSVLLEGQTNKEKLVSAGDTIKMVYHGSAFEVSSYGISLESGSRGDMVRAKTSDQKKDLVGQVIERGVIQIQ